MPGTRTTTSYAAQCPSCGRLADWSTTEVSTDDPARHVHSYVISCGCDQTEPPVAAQTLAERSVAARLAAVITGRAGAR